MSLPDDHDDDDLCAAPGGAEEEELSLPRASINKMIKELVNFVLFIKLKSLLCHFFKVPHIRVANESRELILNCCTEFIHLISSEANEICNQKGKKTISAEHILDSLDKLGFNDFKRDALNVLNDCKQAAAKRRRQSTRLENLGIAEDELLRQQQELFAQARQAMNEEFQQQQFGLQTQTIEARQSSDDEEEY